MGWTDKNEYDNDEQYQEFLSEQQHIENKSEEAIAKAENSKNEMGAIMDIKLIDNKIAGGIIESRCPNITDERYALIMSGFAYGRLAQRDYDEQQFNERLDSCEEAIATMLMAYSVNKEQVQILRKDNGELEIGYANKILDLIRSK